MISKVNKLTRTRDANLHVIDGEQIVPARGYYPVILLRIEVVPRKSAERVVRGSENFEVQDGTRRNAKEKADSR
jgi:hypothetical protein